MHAQVVSGILAKVAMYQDASFPSGDEKLGNAGHHLVSDFSTHASVAGISCGDQNMFCHLSHVLCIFAVL